jgi:hypothetical protein
LLLDLVIINAVRNITSTARKTIRLSTLLTRPVFNNKVKLRQELSLLHLLAAKLFSTYKLL